jgi:hypothetical protein
MILDIKHYILSPIPSKLILPKPSIAINHQMAVIHVQVRINFIEDILLDCGSGNTIIMEKLRV